MRTNVDREADWTSIAPGTPVVVRYLDAVRFEAADASHYRPWTLELIGWLQRESSCSTLWHLSIAARARGSSAAGSVPSAAARNRSRSVGLSDSAFHSVESASACRAASRLASEIWHSERRFQRVREPRSVGHYGAYYGPMIPSGAGGR